MSTRNDWRPGISNAFTTPSSAASTKMCHTCTLCVSVSAASTNASSIDATWVAITTCLRLLRSATIPPDGRKQEDRNLAGKSHRAQLQSRTRQPVDEPRLRHGLHPGADQGNQLSAEKKLEVAMPQRASRPPASALCGSRRRFGAAAGAFSWMEVFRLSHDQSLDDDCAISSTTISRAPSALPESSRDSPDFSDSVIAFCRQLPRPDSDLQLQDCERLGRLSALGELGTSLMARRALK